MTTLPAENHWHGSAREGLDRIAAELTADVVWITARDEDQRRARLVEQARDGLDLVFCIGQGFEEIVYTEAGAWPDTNFVILPGKGRAGNVGGIEFLSDGVGYVAGVVAAHFSDTAAVGILRGSGGAWLERLEEGFFDGFSSVRSGAEQITAAPPDGPWELASRGAAVALYASDQWEEKLLAEAHDAGLLLVGTDPELLEREPDVVVAAIHVDVAEAMLQIAQAVQHGTFQGGPHVFGYGAGVLDVMLNPTMPSSELDPLQEALDVARREVTEGLVELEELGF
jgi:basic membrane protein A